MKEYSNPHLREIWQQAQNALAQADEVIFVGYSMPDADIVLRTMFVEGIVTNRATRVKSPVITLVDYSRSETTKVVQQYQRRFGKLTYFKDGFAKYIQQYIIVNP